MTTLLKAKWASLAVGLVFAPVWFVAAIRLARPSSWWARRFYDEAKLERARARNARPRYRAAVAVVLTLSLASVAGLYGLLDAYRIPGAAMEPTLRCPKPAPSCTGDAADRVVGLRYVLGTNPGRGAIVVHRSTPDQAARCGGVGTFVHCVVGLPGERLSQEGDMILVDGEPLEEAYLPGEASRAPVLLSGDRSRSTLFVLGDNRTTSCDSRWGALPARTSSAASSRSTGRSIVSARPSGPI